MGASTDGEVDIDVTKRIRMSQHASLMIEGGFNGRAWLSVPEWQTYRRRVAVRYLRTIMDQIIARDGNVCHICGQTKDIPLQLAHKVPFKIGVVDWGLTPDWLDGIDNLCLAHRGACNDRAEIAQNDIPSYLRSRHLCPEESPAVATGHLIILSDGGRGDRVIFRGDV